MPFLVVSRRLTVLDFYFPNVQFGLLENQRIMKISSVTANARTNDLQALKRDYQPGELSQAGISQLFTCPGGPGRN
jgi:hypothetical protein